MTRAAVTLCAPLLALALTATPARAATVPLRPGEPPLPPDLAALAQKMEAVRVISERFRLRTSITASGAHLPREAEAFQKLFDTDLSGEATLSPPAGSFALTLLGHTLRLRVVHETVYVYEPRVAHRDGGRPWVDLGRGGGLDGLFGPGGGGSPASAVASTFRALASTLRGARSVTELGHGVIDDQSITGFRATVAPAALEEPAVPAKPRSILRNIFAQRAAARSPRSAPAPPSTLLETFIAASGLPVRTRISESSEGLSTGTLLDVFAINFPLRVQPPARGRTVSLAALRRLTERRSGRQRPREREDDEK